MGPLGRASEMWRARSGRKSATAPVVGVAICARQCDIRSVVLACTCMVATMEGSHFHGGRDMSNPALNQPETAAPSDGESRDPITDALKTIEQTHAALMRVRAQVEDATRLLSEFARISAVFDSVGDRLVNATFKASGEATRGVPSHTVLVAFVEELGDLARLSLGGARD